MGSDAGCGLLIHTADVMGNACDSGGASVTCDAFGTSAEVRANVEDNGDGTYQLSWNSNASGVFKVAIKINNEHVVGSPTQIRLISTEPELGRSELSGAGLTNAVAGIVTTFTITFFDQFGNAATPRDDFKFGLALLKAGEKNKEAKEHDDFSMRCVEPSKGRYEVSYTPTKDGAFDLHVWVEEPPPRAGGGGGGGGETDGKAKAERTPFPNSPFHCVVAAGAASPRMSFVDGWSKESRAVDKHGKALQQDTNLIIAGDTVVLKPQICDELGNLAALPEGALAVSIVYPDGSGADMATSSAIKFTTASKGGISSYDLRHEATHAGAHLVHVLLHGTPVRGSPVAFDVHESVAEVKMCQLTPPSEFPLYSSSTYGIVLKTFDRFGNPMSHGGLPVSTRLQLIKSGVHDLTTLMPNNHTVEVVDRGDGSYLINVTLIKIAATVKVIVNMDKNIPAGGGELPPAQLSFLPTAADGDAAAGAPAPRPQRRRRPRTPGTATSARRAFGCARLARRSSKCSAPAARAPARSRPSSSPRRASKKRACGALPGRRSGDVRRVRGSQEPINDDTVRLDSIEEERRSQHPPHPRGGFMRACEESSESR